MHRRSAQQSSTNNGLLNAAADEAYTQAAIHGFVSRVPAFVLAAHRLLQRRAPSGSDVASPSYDPSSDAILLAVMQTLVASASVISLDEVQLFQRLECYLDLYRAGNLLSSSHKWNLWTDRSERSLQCMYLRPHMLHCLQARNWQRQMIVQHVLCLPALKGRCPLPVVDLLSRAAFLRCSLEAAQRLTS